MGSVLPPVSMARTQGNSALLLNNELNFNSDSWISDFVAASQDSVCIKDTHKYLLVNATFSNWCGIESIDMLTGISPHDLWIEDICHRREKLRLNSAVIQCQKYEQKMAKALEDKVKSCKHPSSVNHVVLNFNGFICYVNTTKVPILDRSHKKVIAFMTLYHYFTSQRDLSELFQLYQQYYPNHAAIELLLKYLKIDSYFAVLPTVKETEILLAMFEHSSRKRIAKRFNISVNTVASHVQHMREKKLIKPDFDEVLIQLRKVPMDKNSKFNQICAPIELMPA